MKGKTKIILIALFFSGSIMLVSFGEQKAEWKGKIEYEDGIKVIKNPREPLYGEITFELEEDLSIGKEDDENYIFYKGIWIEVDSYGNISVLDIGNYRIQKFDKNGNYLQTIGRQGQGPGEFERPIFFCLDYEDNVYVQDGRQMHVFDKNGEFKKSISLPNLFFPYYGVTEEGNFLAQINSSKDLIKGTEEVVLVNPEGKKLKTVASFPYENPPPIRGNIYIGDRYSPRLIFHSINEEMGVYGYSSEYKLFVINSSGELVQIIEKDQPGDPFTRKEKIKIIDERVEREKQTKRRQKFSRSEIKKAIRFPKYKSFFSMILSDDKDRIYVIKYKLSIDEDKNASFDLFNLEGYYLYKVKMSLYPRIIKNGYIYKSERDQDTGYSRVKRYKIKNWEQIKKGI